MHSLLVDSLSLPDQALPDPPVSVTRPLPAKLLHLLHQKYVQIRPGSLVALRRAGLAQNMTRPALGDSQRSLHVPYGSASPGRAQKFPSATSFKMLMSTAWSATIFFRRTFSFSSAFSFFRAWTSTPPYRLRHRWNVASLTPSRMLTSAIEAPPLRSSSASRSLPTICSGVCRFFFFESLLPFGPLDSHSTWIRSRGAGQCEREKATSLELSH
mgnify:CR=1 FL=1